MTPSFSSKLVDDRTTDLPTPSGSRARLRLSLVATIATAIVAIVMLNACGKPARGDDKDQSKPGTPVPAQASYHAFLAEIHRSLKRDDDRLIGLAKQVLEVGDDPDHLPQEPITALELRVRSAEARYRAAKLDREIARSRLEEFQKVTFVQELSAVESQIATAKEDLERNRKFVPVAEQRLDRIMVLLKDESPLSLQLRDSYDAAVFASKLVVEKGPFVLEAAETAKKVLLYTKHVSTKELQASIASADSDELAKQATWDLEKMRLVKTRRPIKRPALPDVQKRILALLQQAYPIREAIGVKLARLVDVGQADDALQTSLRDLTNQLDSLVDRAAGERVVSEIDGLKHRVRRAAHPSIFQSLFGN